MKICIYGAGAIGGFLAVELENAGVDVSCIARGPHLSAMQKHGLRLRIDGIEKTAKIKCSDDPGDFGPQDYVIITLKAHSAAAVADRVAPLLNPDTGVVTAQNGVPWWYFYKLEGPWQDRRLKSVDPGDKQWKHIGPQRAIGCVVYPSAEVIEPGVVKHIEGNRFSLGEPSGEKTERVQRLSKVLIDSGLKAPVRRIRDEIWLKLWGNLAFNPISALTQATLDVIAGESPGTRDVARAMMLEAQAIGERLGARFAVDVEKRIDGAAKVGAHKTSMLQDLERGRPLEIDALLTVVREMGNIVGVQTPTINMVLALLQQRARVAGCYP